MPRTKVVNVSFEGVIAASKIEIGDDKVEGGEMLSNGKTGWDCESWSTEEEEF